MQDCLCMHISTRLMLAGVDVDIIPALCSSHSGEGEAMVCNKLHDHFTMCLSGSRRKSLQVRPFVSYGIIG